MLGLYFVFQMVLLRVQDVECVQRKRCATLFGDVLQFSTCVFVSTSFAVVKSVVNIRMPDRYCLVSMVTRGVHVSCRCAATHESGKSLVTPIFL
jgi:hypothetical protein